MQSKLYNDLVIFNGKLVSADQINLGIDNRSFKYGDGLFESIRLTNGEPRFLNYHYERLIEGMKLLKIETDNSFTEEFLLKQITRLRAVISGAKEGRIRVTIYRNGGGLYTPNVNSFSYLLELTPLAINGYPLNINGLHLDVYNEITKPLGVLSNYKTNNALVSVLAGVYKSGKGLDEAVILNQEGRVCEAISSNIFFTTLKNEVVTPALSEGCLAGVMRRVVMERLSINYQVSETEVNINNLADYKECFITNATRGVQWVQRIGNINFGNEIIQTMYPQIDL